MMEILLQMADENLHHNVMGTCENYFFLIKVGQVRN